MIENFKKSRVILTRPLFEYLEKYIRKNLIKRILGKEQYIFD